MSYNGWKNRQTWNVALWINNDEWLYRLACEYVRQAKRVSYDGFLRYAGLSGVRTPDNISYSGTRLDYSELTDRLKGLI